MTIALSANPRLRRRTGSGTGCSLVPPGFACNRDTVRRVRTEAWPRRTWICSSFLPFARYSLAQVRRKSCGARCSSSSRRAQSRTTYQTTFSEIPRPQADPCPTDSPENASFGHIRGCHPSIHGVLHPDWDRYGTDVPTFSDQVDMRAFTGCGKKA